MTTLQQQATELDRADRARHAAFWNTVKNSPVSLLNELRDGKRVSKKRIVERADAYERAAAREHRAAQRLVAAMREYAA